MWCKNDIIKGFIKIIPSYIRTDKPHTIHKNNILHKVAELKEEKIDQISHKIIELFQKEE